MQRSVIVPMTYQTPSTARDCVLDAATDREWAERLAPTRRDCLLAAGSAAVRGTFIAERAQALTLPAGSPAAAAFRTLNGDLKPFVSPPNRAVSEWGDHTLSQLTVRPAGVWPGERFPVELGDWNLAPRGPHVTPSLYFGFTNDLLPVVIPWLQLNNLGLTVLVHPNTDDPRADHLYYTLWVNRSPPVNAYEMKTPLDKIGRVQIEQIVPNVAPTVKLEV